MLRLPKVANPLLVIQAQERQGHYNFALHARARLEQREITVFEVQQVIRSGFHEVKKDQYKLEYEDWNYAIRGKTLDGKKLRLAISIKSDGFLIITVIDLEK